MSHIVDKHVSSVSSGNPNAMQNQQASVSAEMLIMMAIEDMNNSLTQKTTLDAQLASTLANTESTYMQMQTTNVLQPDITAIQNAGSNQGALDQANAQFGLDQTTTTTTDNLIKAVESTSTTATSSDNSNMSNFMQFASASVQLLGFAVQLLQHAM